MPSTRTSGNYSISDNTATIEASFGTADVVRDSGARRLHYYLRRGIMVTEESARVEVFDLCAPFDAPHAARVAAALHAN